MASKNKSADHDQRARFIETAKKTGAADSGKAFENALEKIIPQKRRLSIRRKPTDA